MLARAVLPLAFVFILAACGGPAKPTGAGARDVQGAGYTFAAPRAWRIGRSERTVVAHKGAYLVSVTRFRLEKPYEPSKFAAAAAELDRVASQLAARSGGKVTEQKTVTVDGDAVRAYRYTGRKTDTRIGFVLRGPWEYQLLCQGPAAAGTSDPDGACALLFSSFAAR